MDDLANTARLANITKASTASQFTFYRLLDPRLEVSHYIGITQMELRERLRLHLTAAKNPNIQGHDTRKSEWIRSVLNDGSEPIIEEIESKYVIPRIAYQHENKLIAQYLQDGHPLSIVVGNTTSIRKYVPRVGERHMKDNRVCDVPVVEKHPYAAHVQEVHDIVIEDTAEQIVRKLFHKNPREFWYAVKKVTGLSTIRIDM